MRGRVPRVAIALCDRGTLDGAAYWPGGVDALASELAIDRRAERARNTAVIHLRTPGAAQGYDQSNAVRVESALEAQAIDARIETAWDGHPLRCASKPRSPVPWASGANQAASTAPAAKSLSGGVRPNRVLRLQRGWSRR